MESEAKETMFPSFMVPQRVSVLDYPGLPWSPLLFLNQVQWPEARDALIGQVKVTDPFV